MPDYVVCVMGTTGRGERARFQRRPGPTRFLQVPDDQVQVPAHAIGREPWVKAVMDEAVTGVNPLSNKPMGDVLVFIHGYNSSQEIVINRHRRLKRDLQTLGYRGTLVSYDWPSVESTMLYLKDRRFAKRTAERLTRDCISLFSAQQARGCEINVHLLGHSMGAYLIRHAFSDADEVESLKTRPWLVSQIALIGADISSRSMAEDQSKSESLYRHCVRLTNYQNPFDWVLKLSNTKRVGLRPRAGRVELPPNAPAHAVNVNCGPYFDTLDGDTLTRGEDYYGDFWHSWHIGDMHFTRDLLHTLRGDIDRHAIPTRAMVNDKLILAPPPPRA